MKYRVIFVTVALFLAIGLVLPGCASGEPSPTEAVSCLDTSVCPELDWVLATTEPSHDGWHVSAFDRAAERIALYTDGKFNITVKLQQELGIERDEFSQALGEGSIEIAFMQSAPLEAQIPSEGVFSLPFFTRTLEDCHKGVEATAYIREPRMKELGYTPAPGAYFVWMPQDLIFVEEVKDMIDLSGLRIRVWRTGDAKLLAELGAEPIYMSYSEVYMALQRGVIDGLNTSCDSMSKTSMWEVGNYFYRVDLAPSTCYVSYNTELFNGLPDKYKMLLNSELEAASQEVNRERAGEYQVGFQIMESNGVVMNMLNPEEIKVWQEKARPIWEEWADEDATNREAYDVVKKILNL